MNGWGSWSLAARIREHSATPHEAPAKVGPRQACARHLPKVKRSGFSPLHAECGDLDVVAPKRLLRGIFGKDLGLGVDFDNARQPDPERFCGPEGLIHNHDIRRGLCGLVVWRRS